MPGTAASLAPAAPADLQHQMRGEAACCQPKKFAGPELALHSLSSERPEAQQEHGVHSTLHGPVGASEAAAVAAPASAQRSSDRDRAQQPASEAYLGEAPGRILGASLASVLTATSAPTPGILPSSHTSASGFRAVAPTAATPPPTPGDWTQPRACDFTVPAAQQQQQQQQQQQRFRHRNHAHTVDLACVSAARSETSDSSDADCEAATRRLTAAFPNLSSSSRRGSEPWSSSHTSTQPPSQQRRLGPEPEPVSPSRILSSASSTCSDVAEALERRRLGRNNYHLMGQAAVELFMRLNHARQTLDFAKRQASLFSTMDRAQMDVWQALDKLNELREYEAALMSGSTEVHPDMALREHALQTAELCRLAHPDKDWLHLVGLIHGLGKLLAHQAFGAQPQWATCGESFPLGCRFDPSLQGTQFFSVNPDRRRRLYNTPLGIYRQGCGLQHVHMSWSAAEYLYLILLLNEVHLPPAALFIIRHQKFTSLTKPGSTAYQQLLSNEDKALLPLLASFQQLSAYRRVALPAQQSEEAQGEYYQQLVRKYIGDRQLSW